MSIDILMWWGPRCSVCNCRTSDVSVTNLISQFRSVALSLPLVLALSFTDLAQLSNMVFICLLDLFIYSHFYVCIIDTTRFIRHTSVIVILNYYEQVEITRCPLFGHIMNGLGIALFCIGAMCSISSAYSFQVRLPTVVLGLNVLWMLSMLLSSVLDFYRNRSEYPNRSSWGVVLCDDIFLGVTNKFYVAIFYPTYGPWNFWNCAYMWNWGAVTTCHAWWMTVVCEFCL